MRLTYKQVIQKALESTAKAYLTAVLQEAGGSPLHAAKLAGCHRTHFYALLNRHGLLPPSERRDKTIRGIAEARVTAARRKRYPQSAKSPGPHCAQR